jgi:hypothetical protein
VKRFRAESGGVSIPAVHGFGDLRHDGGAQRVGRVGAHAGVDRGAEDRARRGSIQDRIINIPPDFSWGPIAPRRLPQGGTEIGGHAEGSRLREKVGGDSVNFKDFIINIPPKFRLWSNTPGRGAPAPRRGSPPEPAPEVEDRFKTVLSTFCPTFPGVPSPRPAAFRSVAGPGRGARGTPRRGQPLRLRQVKKSGRLLIIRTLD